jgi:hypothetical protein
MSAIHRYRSMHAKYLSFLTAIVIAVSWSAGAAPKPPEKVADGIVVPVNDTFLKVQVYAGNVVRIACARDRAFFDRQSVVTEPKRAVKTDWSLRTEMARPSSPRRGSRST